jgi:hypothetical protein
MAGPCALERPAKPPRHLHSATVRVTIVPEPPELEREAILAALVRVDERQLGGWAEAALAEGVEEAEPEP